MTTAPPSPQSFFQKELRIFYININPHVLDAKRMALEQELKHLSRVCTLEKIATFSDLGKKPCDLLLINASYLEDEALSSWLYQLPEKIEKQGSIWIPAIIVAKTQGIIQQSLFHKVVETNWYFDIVSPDHISSLPLRAASLLRIHDHLHELYRYEKSFQELQAELALLKEQLLEIKDKGA